LETGRSGHHQRAPLQPARTNASGGLRDKDVDFNTLLDPSSETMFVGCMNSIKWPTVCSNSRTPGGGAVAALSRDERQLVLVGGKDPAIFIKLWRQMLTISQDKRPGQLLWVYSPGSGGKTAAYYPGDRMWT